MGKTEAQKERDRLEKEQFKKEQLETKKLEKEKLKKEKLKKEQADRQNHNNNNTATLTTPSETGQSIDGSQGTLRPAPEDAYDILPANHPTSSDGQNGDTPADRVQTGDDQAGTSDTGHTGSTDPLHSAANASSSSQTAHVPPNPAPNVSARAQDDATTSNTLPKPSVQSTAKELAAIDELLRVMKRTFTMMGTTFDVLGQQATKVAELGPAMNAKQQASRLTVYFL